MNDKTNFDIYVLKTTNDDPNFSPLKIYESIKSGKARFAWSYDSNSDLINLKKEIDTYGYKSLKQDQKICWDKSKFLLNIKKGDWLVYVNVPSYGECTICKVQNTYSWDDWGDDFRHVLPINKDSIYKFDRNDKEIHPTLSRRFKLPGRKYKIYLKEEFNNLLDKLSKNELKGIKSDTDSRWAQLNKSLKPILSEITKKIHEFHPEKNLEDFMARVLESIPNVRDVRNMKGRADNGADIIVEFESGMPVGELRKLEKCAVQVKSFEGEMDDSKAIDDLKKAFDSDDSLTCGLIISTAENISDAFMQRLSKEFDENNKIVEVLYGQHLARFVMKYGTELK